LYDVKKLSARMSIRFQIADNCTYVVGRNLEAFSGWGRCETN
jgi:hypothetical protein